MKSNPLIHLSFQIRLQPKLCAIFDLPDAQHLVQSVLATPELVSSWKRALKTLKRVKSNMADCYACLVHFHHHLTISSHAK